LFQADAARAARAATWLTALKPCNGGGRWRCPRLVPVGHGAIARISPPPGLAWPAQQLSIAASSSASSGSIHKLEPDGSIASVCTTCRLIG